LLLPEQGPDLRPAGEPRPAERQRLKRREAAPAVDRDAPEVVEPVRRAVPGDRPATETADQRRAVPRGLEDLELGRPPVGHVEAIPRPERQRPDVPEVVEHLLALLPSCAEDRDLSMLMADPDPTIGAQGDGR